MIKLYNIAYEVGGQKMTLYPFYGLVDQESNIVKKYRDFSRNLPRNIYLDFKSIEIFYPNVRVKTYKKSKDLLKIHTLCVNDFSVFSCKCIYEDNIFSFEQEKNKTKYGYPFVLNDYKPHITLETNIDEEKYEQVDTGKLCLSSYHNNKWEIIC